MSYTPSSAINSPSRSQNRVTFASGPSSASVPPTPKSRTPGRRTNRPSRQNSNSTPCFAGSKFSDSPSARAIPLPPSDWFQELCGGSGSDSDTGSMAESVSSTDRAQSVSSQSSITSQSPVGIRLNPLQLIAAVTVGAA